MKNSLSAGVVAVAVMVGCVGVAAVPAHAQQRGQADQPLPKELVLEDLPPDALEITSAAASVQVGEQVVLHGRVAGTENVITPGGAWLTLNDDAAAAACCPKDGSSHNCTISAEDQARIQIGELRGSSRLTGGGIVPGAEVFVVGEVTSKKPLTVKAKGVHMPRESLPAGFFVREAPAKARDVSEVRKESGLKKGDKVVLRGKIGGSAQPFVDDRALFTLMGSALKACNENPGDSCSKPWDYCCETREDITANSATVRVSNEKGNPLRTDLKGRAGIKELSEVIVVGRVVSADRGTLIIDATAMHVARP